MFGKDKKEKKEKKPKSKARKIVDWVITGVFATLIVGLAVIQIINRFSKNQNLFGAQFQKVLTDSMSPTYKVNDIIFIAKANPDNLVKSVEAGQDVDVSFKWKVNGQTVSMTHRLQEATYYAEAQVDDKGQEYHYTFVAHGINKHSEFCKIGDQYGDCTYQTQTFHEDALIGRVVRKSYFMTFATSIWGLLVLLLIPCLYLVIASVIDICKALDDKEEKPAGPGKPDNSKVVGEANDPLAGLSEKEKEKLKQQMLDEMLGKKKE